MRHFSSRRIKTKTIMARPSTEASRQRACTHCSAHASGVSFAFSAQTKTPQKKLESQNPAEERHHVFRRTQPSPAKSAQAALRPPINTPRRRSTVCPLSAQIKCVPAATASIQFAGAFQGCSCPLSFFFKRNCNGKRCAFVQHRMHVYVPAV